MKFKDTCARAGARGHVSLNFIMHNLKGHSIACISCMA